MGPTTQIRKQPPQYGEPTTKNFTVPFHHFTYCSGIFQADQLFVLFVSPHGGTDLEHFEV